MEKEISASAAKEPGMKAIAKTFMLFAVVSLGGCATVFGDRYNHVNIETTPIGADFEVRNGANTVVASGVTPSLVKLKSSAGYFKRGVYSVRFHMDGYEDVEVPLVAGMRGIYWGNILVSGPIGLFIVDPASGAMWALPRSVKGDLQPGAVAMATPVAAQQSDAPRTLSRDEQLYELQQQTGIGYEEYMRRYRAINGQR